MYKKSYIMPTYGERNLEFIKGKGIYLYTKKYKRYLDFGSGIGVNSLGHCHPELVKTIKKQSTKLWHVSNLYFNKDQEDYAKIGSCLHFEIKVEHFRRLTPAIVVNTPFYNPERKRSCPK